MRHIQNRCTDLICFTFQECILWFRKAFKTWVPKVMLQNNRIFKPWWLRMRNLSQWPSFFISTWRSSSKLILIITFQSSGKPNNTVLDYSFEPISNWCSSKSWVSFLWSPLATVKDYYSYTSWFGQTLPQTAEQFTNWYLIVNQLLRFTWLSFTKSDKVRVHVFSSFKKVILIG